MSFLVLLNPLPHYVVERVVDEDINVNEMAIYELVCTTCGIKVDFEDVVTQEQIEQSTRS